MSVVPALLGSGCALALPRAVVCEFCEIVVDGSRQRERGGEGEGGREREGEAEREGDGLKAQGPSRTCNESKEEEAGMAHSYRSQMLSWIWLFRSRHLVETSAGTLHPPLQRLRTTVPKSIVRCLPRKHAESQPFVMSLSGYPGRDVPRSVLSGTLHHPL